MAAASPEEAARLGRTAQRTRPHLVAPDWETAKLFVMYAGLKAKVRIWCPCQSSDPQPKASYARSLTRQTANTESYRKAFTASSWSTGGKNQGFHLKAGSFCCESSIMFYNWKPSSGAYRVVWEPGLVQFLQHAGPRASLLSTARGSDGQPLDLVEAAPHDFFWGRGVDNSGSNHLGVLLMRVRNELLASNGQAGAPAVMSIRPHALDSIVTAQ